MHYMRICGAKIHPYYTYNLELRSIYKYDVVFFVDRAYIYIYICHIESPLSMNNNIKNS